MHVPACAPASGCLAQRTGSLQHALQAAQVHQFSKLYAAARLQQTYTANAGQRQGLAARKACIVALYVGALHADATQGSCTAQGAAALSASWTGFAPRLSSRSRDIGLGMACACMTSAVPSGTPDASRMITSCTTGGVGGRGAGGSVSATAGQHLQQHWQCKGQLEFSSLKEGQQRQQQ